MARRLPEAVPAGAEREERIEAIRGVSLFDDLKAIPGAIEALSGRLESRDFAAGQAIIREGETGAEMFLLVRGRASVQKKTTEGELYRVAILDGADHAFFGEGALLDSEARSATITAEGACHCLVLPRPGFEAFATEHPQWALPVLLKIARAVMARFRKTNNDLMLLYNALVAEIRGQG